MNEGIPVVIWVNLAITAIGTVSDLVGGAMCLSQQFTEGHFVFWGITIFFYSNVTDIMLSTYAMFKSELKIQCNVHVPVVVTCIQRKSISLFTQD